ncbi:MAG: ORF6N domain-containing protein [Bacteroidota bacterium]
MVTYPKVISQNIEKRIFLLRGYKVLLDSDISSLYGVPTKVLMQSVKRNIQRFPSEFMFQLSDREYLSLRSQIVTSKNSRGGRRYLPFVFTEHGVAMLATVLRSERAVQMSIQIIKAFVRLRQFLSSHKDLAEKLKLLEERMNKHDHEIQTIIETIRQMLAPPLKPKRVIGFRISESTAKYRIKRK